MHVNISYDIQECKRALAIKGWDQKDVADKTHLSEAVVSKFFRGKTVENLTAKKIITKLGVRMEDVVLISPLGLDEEKTA